MNDETNESTKAARAEMRKAAFVGIAKRIAGRDEADPAGAFARELAAAGYGSTATTAPPPPRVSSLLSATYARLQRRADGDEPAIELPHGIAEVYQDGLRFGMHMLVGGTGTGKSQIALAMALHAARSGTPVLYVALELDELQIVTRLAMLAAGRGMWSTVYLGNGSAEDRAHFANGMEALRDLPIHVVEAPPAAYSPADLRRDVEAVRAVYPEPKPGAEPMLVVVDFVQIMGGEGREELRERIGRAGYACRALARDHNAAMLVLSSSARENYKADGALLNIVSMAKLDGGGEVGAPTAIVGLGKESGDLESAADSVSVLARVGPHLVIAAGKARAGVTRWCALTFDGTQVDEGNRADVLAAAEESPKGNGTGRSSKPSKPSKASGTGWELP